MSWTPAQAQNETPQPPRLFLFLLIAIGLHLVLFFFGLLFGGIYGVPGPGGGDALIFQLAAGDAHDRFAAPKAVEAKRNLNRLSKSRRSNRSRSPNRKLRRARRRMKSRDLLSRNQKKSRNLNLPLRKNLRAWALPAARGRRARYSD